MKLCRAIGAFAGIVTLTCRAITKTALQAGLPGQLVMRIAADQRRIWSFPLTAARGDAWKPALGVMGATAALIALDPVDTPWLQQIAFRRLPAVRRINRVLSGRNMALAINAAWLFAFFAGCLRGDRYAMQTGRAAACPRDR